LIYLILLLPILEGGALRVVMSLDEQEWLRISQTNPGLAQLLNRIVVKPLDQTEAMQVMEDQVLLLEGRHKVVYMYARSERSIQIVRALYQGTGNARQSHKTA
jgi:hypothetical protein